MIWLVRLFELGIALLAVLFFVTQIVIPAYRGRPYFPILRSSKLENELAKRREILDEAQLAQEIAKTDEAVDDIDLETSRIRGGDRRGTMIEFERLCREEDAKKRRNENGKSIR